MEVAVFFILLILVGVLAALAAVVYPVAATFRHRRLSPDAKQDTDDLRPIHSEVESEQSTDFVGTG